MYRHLLVDSSIAQNPVCSPGASRRPYAYTNILSVCKLITREAWKLLHVENPIHLHLHLPSCTTSVLGPGAPAKVAGVPGSLYIELQHARIPIRLFQTFNIHLRVSRIWDTLALSTEIINAMGRENFRLLDFVVKTCCSEKESTIADLRINIIVDLDDTDDSNLHMDDWKELVLGLASQWLRFPEMPGRRFSIETMRSIEVKFFCGILGKERNETLNRLVETRCQIVNGKRDAARNAQKEAREARIDSVATNEEMDLGSG